MNFNRTLPPRNSPKNQKQTSDIKLIKSKFLKNYQTQRAINREQNNLRFRKIDARFLNSGENSEYENYSDIEEDDKGLEENKKEIDNYQIELEKAWNQFYLEYFNDVTGEWELDIDQEEFAQLEQVENIEFESTLQSYLNSTTSPYETNFNCCICSTKLIANYPYLQCNNCEISYTEQLMEALENVVQNHSSSCDHIPFYIKESEFSISILCENCNLFNVY